MQKTTPKVKILAGFFLTASVIAFVVGIALIIITHNFWWVFLPATGIGGFLGTLSGMSDKRRLTAAQAQRLDQMIKSLGYTRSEVALRSGVTIDKLGAILDRKKSASPEQLQKLADAMYLGDVEGMLNDTIEKD